MGTITWHRDEPLALVFKPVGDPIGGATAQVLVIRSTLAATYGITLT